MAAWHPVAGGPQSVGRGTDMAVPNPGLPSPLVGSEDAASSELRPAQKPPMHQLQPFCICYALH